MASGSYSEGAVEESENGSGVRRFFLEAVLAKSGGFRRSRLFDQHRVALLKAVWVWDAGDCVGVVDSAEFPCTKWPPQDVWRRSLSAALTLVTSPAEDGDHHF
jgi:hypothetical protein